MVDIEALDVELAETIAARDAIAAQVEAARVAAEKARRKVRRLDRGVRMAGSIEEMETAYKANRAAREVAASEWLALLRARDALSAQASPLYARVFELQTERIRWERAQVSA